MSPPTEIIHEPASGEIPEPKTSILDTDEFDPSLLDPSKMFMPGGKPPEKKVQEEDLTKAPGEKKEPINPTDPDPASLDPSKQVDPVNFKPEPKNFRELKALRATAEADRDKFRTERDALAAKLADLEPKASGYEAERVQLQEKLKKHEEDLVRKDDTLRRTAAKELPEWKEKADLIHGAARTIGEIMELPEMKESGVSHTIGTLLDPSKTDELNETLKALYENGFHKQADKLLASHNAVQVWRGELRNIENESVQRAKQWRENRDNSLNNTFRDIREELSAHNAIHNPRSPEFLALPKESQEFLGNQYKAAEKAAQEILDIADDPGALASRVYRMNLGMTLVNEANNGAQRIMANQQKELVDLRAKLERYEKAAGGKDSIGGGGGNRPVETDPTDPAELARAFDPRNMPGYKGVGI